MGEDEEASADLADPFENMRTGLYAIRDRYQSASIMSPYDVLRLHTVGSAAVLQASDRLGSLQPFTGVHEQAAHRPQWPGPFACRGFRPMGDQYAPVSIKRQQRVAFFLFGTLP